MQAQHSIPPGVGMSCAELETRAVPGTGQFNALRPCSVVRGNEHGSKPVSNHGSTRCSQRSLSGGGGDSKVGTVIALSSECGKYKLTAFFCVLIVYCGRISK